MSATCVLAVLIAATDPTGAQFVDRDIALVVNLETIALRYGDTTIDPGNTVFFVGEPVTFRVMLNNRLTVPVEVASVNGRWDQAVSFSIRRDGQEFSGVRIAPAPRAGSYRAPQGGSIPAQTAEHVRLAITSNNNSQLPIGQYELESRIPAQMFKGPAPQLSRHTTLSSMKRFEVRGAVTESDRLNRLYHLAVRARNEERFTEAQQLIQQILMRLPRSASAYEEMGLTYRQEGNCVAALQAFEQALAIVRSRYNPGEGWHHDSEKNTALFLSHWEGGLEDAIHECERVLGRR